MELIIRVNKYTLHIYIVNICLFAQNENLKNNNVLMIVTKIVLHKLN